MALFEWMLLAANVAGGTMIGKIVFQSFVVAPSEFRSPDEHGARGFLRDTSETRY